MNELRRKRAYRPSGRAMAGALNPNWKGGDVSKTCERCSVTFTVEYTRRNAARFCTLVCFNLHQAETGVGRGVAKKAKVRQECRWCRAPFDVLPSRVTRNLFCTHRCNAAWRVRNMHGNGYSRARRGKREDIGGQFFRSMWEANYARFLDWLKSRGVIAAWEYEPDTFWFEAIRRGVRSYTPDFKVTEPNGLVYFVEVKGWMDPKSKTKIKRMAKYFPAVDLRVVDAKAYREIDRKIGGAIPGWERAA